jgi:hypothetical protein
MVKRDEAENARLAEIAARSVSEVIARNDIARRNLTRLRIAEQITEAEFENERRELDRERLRLGGKVETQPDRFEPGAICVAFSIRAAEWFREGNDQTKRTILEIAGSNPILFDQHANIGASKLFRQWENVDSIPALLGVVNDVRTLAATDVEAQDTLHSLRKLLAEPAHDLGKAA